MSHAQSAYLASLPLAPTRLSPLKDPTRAIPRQRAALSCLHQHGKLSDETFRRALEEPIILKESTPPFQAPHLTESLRYRRINVTPPGAHTQETDHHLTIDSHLQRVAEEIVSRYAHAHERMGLQQVAAVGLSTSTGEVLFWVGSRGYDHPSAGQVDHVIGQRLPGSTLKPFLYGLALDSGFELDSPLSDSPLHFKTPMGQYKPKNYDHKTRGEVSLMSALAMSLNIPAVWLLNHVGVDRFLDRLRLAGLHTLTEDALHYGLGLSLGDGEVRLIDLVNAYRGLILGGKSEPWRVYQRRENGIETLQRANFGRFMSPRAAQAILQVLSNRALRAPSFGEESALALPFPTAVKTGTSQGYTNAWTVGVSSQVSVGVWVKPHRGAALSGGRIAAPLWRELIREVHRSAPALPLADHQLTMRDKKTLSALMHKERTHQSPEVTHRELSADPFGDDKEDLSSSTLQSTEATPSAQISVKLISPPSGAIYSPLPQRSASDNLLRAEVQIKYLSSKRALSDNVILKWTWNGEALSHLDKHSTSAWIDPWSSSIKEQTVCVVLISQPHEERLSQDCSSFTVLPQNSPLSQSSGDNDEMR